MKKVIIFSVIVLIAFGAIGQPKTYTSTDLPKMFDNETVYFPGEVWSQTARSEVQQRAKQKSCERKLDNAHKVLREKKGLERHIQDSLLIVIEQITDSRDSLIASMVDMSAGEIESCQKDLNKLSQQLVDCRYQLALTKRRLKAIRKRQFTLYLIIVAEAVVIVLIV